MPGKSKDQKIWEAFTHAFPDIIPLKKDNKYQPPKNLPKPRPLFFEADESDVLIDWIDKTELDEVRHYVKAGYPSRILKELRRGKYRCNSELDLHGYDREAARGLLYQFLDEAISYQEECVCIIVGKGRGSQGKPVIPSLVKAWLMQADSVIAFTEASPGQGGTGALFVVLKPPKFNKQKKT